MSGLFRSQLVGERVDAVDQTAASPTSWLPQILVNQISHHMQVVIP
jgi:hypothetical protein